MPNLLSLSLPPTEQLCRAHRKEWDNLEKNESAFVLKCGPDNAAMKYAAGTLEQSDIVNCYRPQCDSTNDQYTTKQCSYIYPEWCWCSSPDGYAIPNTFQRNMPNGYCCKCHRYTIIIESWIKFIPFKHSINFAGRCLATKRFVGKLLALRRPGVGRPIIINVEASTTVTKIHWRILWFATFVCKQIITRGY